MADLNIWKMIGLGDQMSPAVMSQMSSQAPPPMSPFQQPPLPVGPNNPMVIEAPPQRVPVTAQPTTSPLGTLPQEIVPAQPAMQAAPPTAMEMYSQAIANVKLPDNTRALRELQLGEKSYGDAVSREKSEIDKLSEGLAKYASSSPGLDYSPLAALSDSWFGGNLSAAAKQIAPESAAEKTKNMQDMQAKIAGLRAGIPDQEMKMMSNKLAQMGYMDERAIKMEIAKLNMLPKMTQAGNQGTRLGVAQDRLSKDAAKEIHNDPVIRKNELQRQQVELDIHTINSPGILSPQIFNEIQLGVSAAISGGRAASLTAQEKTEFSTLQTKFTDIMQKITNKPEDINSPELREHLSQIMGRLVEAYKINSYVRAKQKMAGSETAYANTPNAFKAMSEAAESYNPHGRTTGHGDVPPQVPAIQPGHVEDGMIFQGGDPSKPESWRPQ